MKTIPDELSIYVTSKTHLPKIDCIYFTKVSSTIYSL